MLIPLHLRLVFVATILIVCCKATTLSSRPNILLFFPDELRYDWGGVHNNPYYNATSLPLHTPHFDWVASTGTRFTRAFVGAPVCAPSRACLASGRDYDHQGLPMNFHNDYNTSIPTFYSVLRANGYHTMVTGRDDLDKSSGGPGLNGSFHTDVLGFSDAIRCDGSTDVTHGAPHEPFGVWLRSQPVTNKTIAMRYNVSNCFDLLAKRFQELGSRRPTDMHGPYGSYSIPDPMPLPDAAYQDNWIGEQAMTLLGRKPQDKPFFIEVSHQAPHPPMDITATMMRTVRNRTFPPAQLSTTPVVQVLMGRQNYAAKIERLDYWLGQYISFLNASNELENTIICIASDHGEMLFDRSGVAKSKPWNSASSVPLICTGETFGIRRDAVVSSPVTTVDLAGTFLDFAGLLSKAPHNMSVHSLKPVMVGAVSTPTRPILNFGLSNFRGVIRPVNSTHAWKFFCCNGICPGATKNDSAGFNGADEHHLFNVLSMDTRFEDPQYDLRHTYPQLVQELASALPPPHMTPANNHSSIPNQGFGYTWKGCTLTPKSTHKR
eukprot:m.150354 g.150354  ORF g.150354 m.150354 type:complete len:548 (+) comp30723_c0_seq4:224-1867(+)